MSFLFDCLLASYLLLASLTIWCAQASVRQIPVETGPPVRAAIRLVEPAMASAPHALGSLACLVAALGLLIGTPFDIRYAAVAVLGVALYLTLLNIRHLIEDWRYGVPARRMLCVRSLLPAILGSPMLIAGLRLI